MLNDTIVFLMENKLKPIKKTHKTKQKKKSEALIFCLGKIKIKEKNEQHHKQ